MNESINISEKEENPALSKASRDIDRLHGRRVLVVEDNEVSLELVLALLDDIGIVATAAVNGQQALAMLEYEQFDVVLMDVQMPVMDGLAATREIRRQSRFANLPVIALTAGGVDRDNSKKEILDAGMNGYIAKPINTNEMFAALSEWVFANEIDNDCLKERGEPDPQPTVALPDIDGINMEVGLAICNGNRSRYLRLLKMFSKEADFVDRFNKVIKTGDMAVALRLVHSLRGTAANIGAERIQAAALVLEKVIKDGGAAKDISLCQADVANALRPVVLALESLLVSQPGIAEVDVVPVLDVSVLSALFRRLIELLSDDDSEAVEIIEDIKACIKGSAHEVELAKLVKKIECYEFETAVVESHRVASVIGIVL